MSKRLVLIDASHMIYRSYHAFSSHGLTSAEGEPTGAVYGVMQCLDPFLREKPSHVAFVLDGGGVNHRHKMFPEYKAGRPEQPDELACQFKHIKAMVRAMGVKIVRKKNHEADDIIGTLALRAAKMGYEVTIVSGDKDFNQLVGGRIHVYNQQKKQKITPKIVRKVYGVYPKQFVDYLALMGDKVDNIPGIPGCGPKTAAAWLQKYDNVEALLSASKHLSPHHVKLIRAHKAHALISKKLARIETTIKELPKIASLRYRGENTVALLELRKKLGFKRGSGAGLRKKKVMTNRAEPPKKGLFGSVKNR